MATTQKKTATRLKGKTTDVLYGNIHITKYDRQFHVTSHLLPEGQNSPQSFGQVLFEGINLNNQPIRKVNIWVREQQLANSNPHVSDDTIYINIPKSDLPLIEEMILRSFEANGSARSQTGKFIVQYAGATQVPQVHVSFKIQ